MPSAHEQVKGFLSKCTVLKASFVIGPSNALFAGVCVCTLFIRKMLHRGWGSGGVKEHKV